MSKYGSKWPAQRLRVLERDGWQCHYCHKPLDGEDATVDHLEPVSLNPGKDYRDDELVSCCRSCNSQKGARVNARVEYRNPEWFN